MDDPALRSTKYGDALPPSSGNALVTMLLGDQRLRWLQGQRIPVEAYFEHYPELRSRPDSVRELLLSELRLQQELGLPLEAANYEGRFPEQAPWLREQFSRLQSASAGGDTDPSEDRETAAVPWPSVPGYEILQEIGRGGMGIVYKARQARLNRFVALKMLVSGPQAGPKARTRFRTEAAAVAQLQNPNIVQIFDILEQDDQLFLSLEYVGGGSLAHKIAGQPQAIGWSAQIIRALALAMQFAHDHGIVHRDLKPSNVLLTDDGIPKITDFGLAKRIDDDTTTTKTGTVLGTPDYMAPEQADGRIHDIGPGTDIYALGAIVYELLTGQPPFRDEAVVRVLDAVRFQRPRSPRNLREEIPPDLEAICLKCLEKEIPRRYSSAAALAFDLDRVLSGQPVHTGFARFRDWLRRQWH